MAQAPRSVLRKIFCRGKAYRLSATNKSPAELHSRSLTKYHATSPVPTIPQSSQFLRKIFHQPRHCTPLATSPKSISTEKMSGATSSATSTNKDTDLSFKIPLKTSVPLRNENNYPQWVTEISRMFRLLRLTPYVTGDQKDKPSLEEEDWQDATDKALILIIDNCEAEPQALVAGCNTAAEAWNALKEHYGGRTETYLSSLFLSILTLRYDDRKTTINEHITTFENQWNQLRQNVASATNSLAAGARDFVNTDSWKATMLLSTLPQYQNIIVNTTGANSEPSYPKTVLRLRELSDRSKNVREGRKEEAEPPAVFGAKVVRCQYCRSKGWPGTSHDERDCRTKKREQSQQQAIVGQQTPSEQKLHSGFAAGRMDGSEWFAASTCPVHITNDLNDLTNARLWKEPVKTGGGNVYSSHVGTTVIHGMVLSKVLYIPDFPRKLVSIGAITSDGGKALFAQNSELEYQGIRIPLVQEGSLFRLGMHEANLSDIEWHERYGHLPLHAFSRIPEAPRRLSSSTYQCEACVKAQPIKPPPPAEDAIRSSAVGELVYSAIHGPLPVESLTGKQYIITLIDDYSRLAIVRAIRSKGDAFTALQQMINAFQNFTSSVVSAIETNHTVEYRSKECLNWLTDQGIAFKSTFAYHSETNVVTERFGRVITTMIRANLGSSLPVNLWELALEYTNFVTNRIPHRALDGKSPVEIAIPTINISTERQRFRPFGQQVYIHSYHEGELEARAIEARIVGFTPTHGIYRVILRNKEVVTAKNPTPRNSTQSTISVNADLPTTSEPASEQLPQLTPQKPSSTPDEYL